MSERRWPWGERHRVTLPAGPGEHPFQTGRLLAFARNTTRDAVAGLVASVVLIGNIVSFGALMFPGDLGGGVPIAIWAMLIGSCVGGAWIALTTSIPPIATGIDSPTGAFLVLLSAAAGPPVLHAGGSAEAAVGIVMLIFTAATLVSGALLFGIGYFRWASYFRFIPYFVVGGFLAATGWFLIAGGVRMTTGAPLSLAGLDARWTGMSLAKLGIAIGTVLVLLGVRRWIKSPLSIPGAILLMWLTAVTALHALGLSDREHGWYLPSLGGLIEWRPLHAAAATQFTWTQMFGLAPEFLAVTIVTVISLVTKVSSLEVARQTSGNLDQEFRAHGIANLLAAPLGGIASGVQTGTSRLLEQAGGATRMSGLACALAIGAVGIANFDLPGMVPIPIVAGLVFYLGYTFMTDALLRPYRQRAWLDLLLALAITVVCVQYGYLVGVLVGSVGACVLFAFNYARLGAVRRHSTRALFASHVDRSAEASEYLRRIGETIQLYWLSGYIFFGSSEGVFERIQGDIGSLAPRKAAYVVLDFVLVSGVDSSAIASLLKLRNFCDQQGIVLVCCGLSPANRKVLELGGLFGKAAHCAFDDLNMALGWCEDQLVAEANLDPRTDIEAFESWLQHQLGGTVAVRDLLSYLERQETEGPQVLYRQGDPADTVDLVADGTLVVDVDKGNGERLRVRRMMTHTVVGEMGFVRGSARSATVSSEGAAILYTMTRANFERMRRERPHLALAFDDFILRTLADRVDAANRATAALKE